MTAHGAHIRLFATVDDRYLSVAAHIARMSRYTEAIALRLGLDADRARLLRGASKLHDIGKLAIPDRVLLKPGKLTSRERTMIERHAPIGYELLADSGSELLDVAASIALSHHERWDGDGYPQGLRGDEIPFEARIAAVADVFDSLTRMRSYRPAFKVAVALETVQLGRGAHFDPDVVDAFFAAQPEIRRIRQRAERVDTLSRRSQKLPRPPAPTSRSPHAK